MDVEHLEEVVAGLVEEVTTVVATIVVVTRHEVVTVVATEGGQGGMRHIKSCEVEYEVYWYLILLITLSKGFDGFHLVIAFTSEGICIS